MSSLLKIIFFLSLIVILPQHLYSQDEDYLPELVGGPKFYFDALSVKSTETDLSRLDVYIEVPYEALHFYKFNDVFRSTYEMTIDIYDSMGTLIDEKWWKENVETKDYNESISPSTSNLSQRLFNLIPGKYFVDVQIKDTESQKVSRLKRKVEVKNFNTPRFSISDVMLANRLKIDSGKTVVYPNISGNVGSLRDSFYIFFEIYNSIASDTADIIVAIHNVKGDIVKSDSFVQPLGAKRKSCFNTINTSQLIAGDYLLDIKAVARIKTLVDAAEVTASTTRSFVIRWRGLPVSVTDLDKAIDQLQYIVGRDKLEEMKKAPPESKRELFREFWKKKDPTPTTERNELMEEYYSRVQYANKHFGHYIDGWKTDMGMIYIIFGSPSNIERHPFEIDSKPYEIWTYYELNREFIFIDVSGFGDYRLQNPIWDLTRTRPR